MEAMKEVLQLIAEFIIETTKDFLTMILNLVMKNVPTEILITAIIMFGVVAIIFIIAKLSTKRTYNRRRH